MTTDPHDVPDSSPARRRRRWWLPITAIVLGAAAIAAVWQLPEGLTVRGATFSGTYAFSALTVLVLAIWFFFLGGFSARTRVAVLLLAVAAVVGAAASVRKVEFSGEMEPTFTFRWQPERAALLEAQRQRLGPAQPLADGAAWRIEPGDVAEYRGPDRDGVVEGPPLAHTWPAGTLKSIWRQPVGGGYAAFIVVGPTAFTVEQRRGSEAVVAYDTSTGAERWIYEYDARFFEPAAGEGPRATPALYDGKVYSLGATGILVCLNASDGSLIWATNILEANGVKNVTWGMSGSPLLYDGLCVVNPGAQGDVPDSRSVWALDAATGEVRWKSGRTAASYASPMLATLGGVRQVLMFDAAGLAGYEADGGELLWSHGWTTLNDINAAQPLVLPDDRVFITSDAGCALLAITRGEAAPGGGAAADPAAVEVAAAGHGTWSVAEVWHNIRMKCAYANPVSLDGYIYGLDRGILACLDVATGDRMWKRGRYGHGQLLLADDLLVVLSEKGELALVEATPEAYRELAIMPAIDGKTWNNPTLVDGRIFVRNHIEMASYDLR